MRGVRTAAAITNSRLSKMRMSFHRNKYLPCKQEIGRKRSHLSRWRRALFPRTRPPQGKGATGGPSCHWPWWTRNSASARGLSLTGRTGRRFPRVSARSAAEPPRPARVDRDARDMEWVGAGVGSGPTPLPREPRGAGRDAAFPPADQPPVNSGKRTLGEPGG
jgi:hypothetical protein